MKGWNKFLSVQAVAFICIAHSGAMACAPSSIVFSVEIAHVLSRSWLIFRTFKVKINNKVVALHFSQIFVWICLYFNREIGIYRDISHNIS